VVQSEVMRHIVFLFLIFINVVVLAAPRTIGVSAPLSGGGAGWGNDVKNVLLFANEKLADGQYRFKFEDDQCNEKTALTIAQKFASIDHLKEVFSVCGQTTIVSAPLYAKAGIVVFAPLGTPSQLSTLGVFRTALSDRLAATMLAQHVSQLHRKVSVLTEENEYPVSFLRDFTLAGKELGLEVHADNFLPEQKDFRPQLLRLKARKTEALFLNTQTEENLLLLVKQLSELQFSPRLYGAYLPGSANFLKNSGILADGLTFVDFPDVEDLLTDEGKNLYAEFTSKYGPIQGWGYAFPATFEAFRALHLAIQSGESVPVFLHREKFRGVFGEFLFDQNGDVVGPKHVLKAIEKGKGQLLK
jgi:branched-chain amino acid transport system substrate-binding protein